MHQFSIGPARTSDCEAVVSLLLDLFRGFHAPTADRQRLTSVVDQTLADTRQGFILVARVTDRLVGVASVAAITSVYSAGRIGWLEALYVEPTSRHHGIGTALGTAVLQHARELGLIAVGLDVDAGHEQAVSLYAALGFNRVRRSTWVNEFSGI